MRQILSTVFFALIMINYSMTQNEGIGIGTDQVPTDAILNVVSPNGDKGVLFPKLNETQRDNLGATSHGLAIYNTTKNQFEYWNNDWKPFGHWDKLNATDHVLRSPNPTYSDQVVIGMSSGTQHGNPAFSFYSMMTGDKLMEMFSPAATETELLFFKNTTVKTKLGPSRFHLYEGNAKVDIIPAQIELNDGNAKISLAPGGIKTYNAQNQLIFEITTPQNDGTLILKSNSNKHLVTMGDYPYKNDKGFISLWSYCNRKSLRIGH